MENKRKKHKFFSLLIVVAISLQTAGCGTLLYPERRGQVDPAVIVHGGALQIDPGVAILDAILFIPGILPGIIAFVVDFSTGAIYLPSKKTGSIELGGNTDFALVDINSETINRDTIGKYIKDKTGKDVSLDHGRWFKMKATQNAQTFLEANHFEAI